jgi:hypothetical protein
MTPPIVASMYMSKTSLRGASNWIWDIEPCTKTQGRQCHTLRTEQLGQGDLRQPKRQ